MTHPDTKPEALWIAQMCEDSATVWAREIDTRKDAAACLRRLHAECESLRHENHNLNWALGIPGYEQMFTAEEQAEADAGHARSVEIIEGMKARKARHEALLPDGRDPLDEIESLRTQLQTQALQSLSTMGQDDATIADLRAQLAEARAEADALRADARRWEWLALRFVGADFDWQDSGVPVVVFSWPEKAFISADVAESVDAAMGAMKEGE